MTMKETCAYSGEEFNIDELEYVSGRMVHEDFLEEATARCPISDILGWREDMILFDEEYYISEEALYEVASRCHSCEEWHRDEDLEDNYCYNCMDEDNDEHYVRGLDNALRVDNYSAFWRPLRTPFKNNFDSKGFSIGVEVECFTNHSSVKNVEDFNLTKREFAYLKNKVWSGGDCSIHGGAGYEFKLKPLENDSIPAVINTLGKMLDNGFKVNKTCGLHIHIGEPSETKLLTEGNKHKIMVLYAIYRDALLSLVSQNRINNNYCDAGKIFLKPSMFDKKYINNVKAYLNKNVQTRYSLINFYAFDGHKTIEIRIHEGTTDPEAIINWVRFNINMFDFAINSTYDELLNLRGSFSELKRLVMKDRDLKVFYNKKFVDLRKQKNENKPVSLIKAKNKIKKDVHVKTVNLDEMIKRTIKI